MNGELVIVDDVAAEFAERVIEAFLSRPNDEFSMALSGGETARRCYERLAADGEQIDWWNVDVYLGDERCVPPDHPDSNERLVRQALLERVGAARFVFPMRCDEGPESYQLRIGELGRMDLVHLGLGADGHVASLFPGSHGLEVEAGQLVVLNEDPSGRNPYKRMTFTLEAVARSRLVLVTVSGEAKREALAKVREAAPIPGSMVRAEHLVWLVDHAAAGE